MRFYSGHFPYFVRDLLGVDVATLTLLRDPVDRTISVLRHFKRLWSRYRDSSLDEIYDDEFVFRHYIENFQTRVFALTRDDAAQSFASARGYREIRDALADPAPLPRPSQDDTIRIDDRRLAIAQANVARVDVVGVSERFPLFVEQLRARFGWWPSGLDLGARANVSTEGWDVRPSLRHRIALDNAYDVELHRLRVGAAGGLPRLALAGHGRQEDPPVLSFRQKKGKRLARVADPAVALADAAELASSGRCLDAVAALTAANRARPDPAIERRLGRAAESGIRRARRERRTAARGPRPRPISSPGRTDSPRSRGASCPPTRCAAGSCVTAGSSSAGLIPAPRVAQLVDDIDRTFDAYDGVPRRRRRRFADCAVVRAVRARCRRQDRTDPAVGTGWRRCAHRRVAALAVRRARGLRGGGSARAAHRLSRRATRARRRRSGRCAACRSTSGTNWHQDGAFLGHGIRTVNVWLTLTHCGDDAPGLDIVPARMGEILPTGTEGAIFDWSVGDAGASSAWPSTRRSSGPMFEPGDAMLFDDYFLHRTAVSGAMTHERYAIESWFFAPSTYPLDQIPVAV